jgi:hypothetical protein
MENTPNSNAPTLKLVNGPAGRDYDTPCYIGRRAVFRAFLPALTSQSHRQPASELRIGVQRWRSTSERGLQVEALWRMRRIYQRSQTTISKFAWPVLQDYFPMSCISLFLSRNRDRSLEVISASVLLLKEFCHKQLHRERRSN